MADKTPAAVQATPSIDDLKVKYGKVYKVCTTVDPDDDTTVNLEYIFKKPSIASYDRYVKTASKGATKALQQFLFDSVTDEYKARLESDLEEYPALALTIGLKLLIMMLLDKDVYLTRLLKSSSRGCTRISSRPGRWRSTGTCPPPFYREKTSEQWTSKNSFICSPARGTWRMWK